MRYRLSELRALIRTVLIEAKDQNTDGENDFRDVKIARMKASGMSTAEIKDDYPDLYEDEDEAYSMESELLGEPDMSAEDERDVDEFSTVSGVRGYQVPLGAGKYPSTGANSFNSKVKKMQMP